MKSEEMKLVSVIMPAYNEEKYIGEAIQSVMDQVYTNWELIIVDDGSKDRTLEIVRQYSDRDLRIRVYQFSENQGACAALNEALKRAEGDYICWLSADDKYKKEMLWSGVEFLTKYKKFQAVFSCCESINADSERIGEQEILDKFLDIGKEGCAEPYYTMVMKGNPFCACNVIARAEAFAKAGFFDERHPYAGDYHYMMKMAAYADFGFLNQITVESRVHSDQVTNEGKNELDAISAYTDIVFSDELRKRLYHKAGIKDTREEILQTFEVRKKSYEYVKCPMEMKAAELSMDRFLTEFPPVVLADKICREISECMNSGDWDRAIVMMQEMRADLLDFVDKETWGIFMANILDYTKDYDKEKEILEYVLNMNESNYEAHYMYGNLCEREKDLKEAVKHYRLSVQYSKDVKEDFEMLLGNLERFLNQSF